MDCMPGHLFSSRSLFLLAEAPHVAEVFERLHDPAVLQSHLMTGANDFDCPLIGTAVFGIHSDAPGMPPAVGGADVDGHLVVF